MFDAVSLSLLADLRTSELAQRPRTMRQSSDDDRSSVPAEPELSRALLPRLLVEAVTFPLAVRIQIVIAR